MEQDKKQLLQEQVAKIEEVLAVLGKDFVQEAEEEINFLNITVSNLKEIVEG